jgi:hypothetical protein
MLGSNTVYVIPVRVHIRVTTVILIQVPGIRTPNISFYTFSYSLSTIGNWDYIVE